MISFLGNQFQWDILSTKLFFELQVKIHNVAIGNSIVLQLIIPFKNWMAIKRIAYSYEVHPAALHGYVGNVNSLNVVGVGWFYIP